MSKFREKIVINEGIEVEYSTAIHASVGDYTIFQNKIWQVTGSDKFTKTLERQINKEKTSVDIRSVILPLLTSPSGYQPI